MPRFSAEFQFTDLPPAAGVDEVHCVEIPPRIARRRQLLELYARELRFPSYFGWNWDALEECLRDLSWLPAPRNVILRHADVPFGRRSENRRVYLGLLRDVVRELAGRDTVVLRVSFPASAEAEVNRALAAGPR